MSEEYEDIKLIIPNIENNIISKHILKLLKNSKNIFKTYQFIQKLNEFEKNYIFRYKERDDHTGDKLIYWIEELKGVYFNTMEAAKFRFFLRFLNLIYKLY